MHPLSRKLKTLQRYTASLLLAVMVYQLGACSCGCLEHNVWAQMLDLDSADHASHSSQGAKEESDVSQVASAETHDCTGEARAQYFNNTRVPRPQGTEGPSGPVKLVAASELSPDSITVNMRRYAIHATLEFDAALYRPAIQVYRL